MMWRFEIENEALSAPRIVKHYSGKDLKLSWTREDERRYDFKVEIDDITFLKDDFKYFLNLEQSEERCELQTLNVYMVCGGEPNLIYTGTFTMSSGGWDLDKCIVKFSIETLDAYTCIEENQDNVNLFDFGLDAQTVDFGFEIGYDSYKCYWGNPNRVPSPICGKSKEGLYQSKLQQNVGFVRGYLWHYIISDCDYNPGEDWEVFESCSNGTIKYRKPFVHEISTDINSDRTDEDLAYFDEDFNFVVNFQPKSTLDNGMKLQEVLQNLLNDICDVYTIVSDFFQWNPENITNINYVTNTLNQYTNLILFQKSDIKRPDDSNNATKAETTFVKLFEQILETFNCGYQIKNGVLRIEHISYFESEFGLNLLEMDPLMKFLQGTRKYSYDDTRLPKYEKFSFMEAGSEDFIGEPISYDSDCVNNDEENKSDTSIDDITTDIFYCLENSTSDSENVSDEGFVLIACDKDNKILFEPGLLNNDTLPNNVLSWAHLHENLFKHGRVLKTGNMNGVETQFETVVPTIKQDQFSLVFSCKNILDFNPLDKLKSTLGWAFVESAELKLHQCVMRLDVMLDELELGKYEETFGDFDDDFSDEFD